MTVIPIVDLSKLIINCLFNVYYSINYVTK